MRLPLCQKILDVRMFLACTQSSNDLHDMNTHHINYRGQTARLNYHAYVKARHNPFLKFYYKFMKDMCIESL